MSYTDNTHITTQDLMFRGVLHDIKKSKVSLQPIFEAFTNAIEAIKIKSSLEPMFKGNISIRINAIETTVESTEFVSLSITDNGIGFNDLEFKRFNTFKDFTKGYKNLGSGRIQYAHYFDKTLVKSIYNEGDKYFEREFIVSKHENFLINNAIVLHKHCKETTETSTGTIINFVTLLENSNIYHNLNANTLKEALIERYIHYFCYNRTSLPKIKLEFFMHSELKDETTITEQDIPKIEKSDELHLNYSSIPTTGKNIQKSDKEEKFIIDSFKVKSDVLKENKLNLTSKGEIVEESGISLQNLANNDNVKGFKYLFLVSSEYIDARDTNIRGVLNIPTKESFTKNLSAFSNEEILLEDIQQGVNDKINAMYPEIEEVKKNHDKQVEKLKEMFLLDNDSAKDINISINDSESKILEKFYEAEAKKTASLDAEIKQRIDRLDNLDPTSEKYDENFEVEITELVKQIPLQNKTTLTHYVARRKLVLELFDKILAKKLKVQNSGGSNIDEKLLHNLIFQQAAESPDKSDLWVVNEDFIYFKGTSESKLKDVVIDGSKILKETLSSEEETYNKSLGEDRQAKRPDILLFPDEGKCIIIEFKNPDVNLSEHLNQINRYASLIRNLSKDEFKFDTFFGYLIGEKLEADDVRDFDSDFKHSSHFDYVFRPAKPIVGKFGRSDGSLYMEVIKYSTLLKRAQNRNLIFLNKILRSK
jgi:hypothetical protein